MSKKNAFPMPAGQSSVLPKLISALITLGLLVLVIKHPAEAASCAKAVVGTVGTAVDGVASFIQQVTT